MTDGNDFLQATSFVDSDDPKIQAFARQAVGNAQTTKDKAIALYSAVRDSISNCGSARSVGARRSR